MKLLVIGAEGFIGKKVVEVSMAANFEVWRSGKNIKKSLRSRILNLFDKTSIKKVLSEIRPDYIISCAGNVENSEKALVTNPVFTLNLLQAIIESKAKYKKIIILGSSGEYGVVGKKKLLVKESCTSLADTFYAKSKVIETSVALYFRDYYKLPIVVARIFNPIGSGMNQRFLIPNLIKQIREIKIGKRKEIEINSLADSRDYIDVADVAEALLRICKKNAKGSIYNIGSGERTTNKTLLKIILKEFNVNLKTKVKNEIKGAVPISAVQADIGKIIKDTGWSPKIKLTDTIKEISNESKRD